MSDIRKLIDTINEMATTSGSVASVAQPMGGVKSRKKDSIFYEGEKCTSCGCEPCKCDSSEGNAVDGTKTPQSPNVSEFGLWKNSALIGQEQREKKKKKSVKESEDLAWDDPDLEKARKLITSKKKDGYTEFKGIDKAILKLKSKNKNTRKHPVNEPKKVKENKAVPYEGDREYNALDDVQDQIAKMAHRHKDEKWTMDDYRRLGKKLAQQSSKTKLDELGNSLMPGGQRSLHLAQETFVDPRNSRRHPGAVDVAEGFMDELKDAFWDGLIKRAKEKIPAEHHKDYDFDSMRSMDGVNKLTAQARAAGHLKKKGVAEEQVNEKITKNTPTADVVKDFVHSKNKMFKSDSKKERINRALGASYGMKKGKE